jgi:hypothetical protein
LNGSLQTVAGAKIAESVAASVQLYPGLGESWLIISASLAPEDQPPAEAHWPGFRLRVGDTVEFRVIDSAEPTPSRIGRTDPTVRASDDIPFVCGICGKSAVEVDGMISGSRSMICHGCVRELHEMLNDGTV